ncbi:MAG: DUF4435 domain-containing protein [Oscillospiraceae bacterium]|nr:DUF4435 domain-containing protein [Oscillospiraceae bacterium]
MNGFDETYQGIRRQLAATPGKRVLLVEGTGDVDFLTWMLDKPPLDGANPHARWVIGAAGGKDSVLRMLARQPDWTGLVDRDAWGEEDIAQAQARTPNLRLLPRYCIENYLIDPDAFTALARSAQNPAQKEALLRTQRQAQDQWPQAVRHGSLWRAVQPLQDALQDMGFNGALLRFRLPDDGAVRKTLDDWGTLLNADTVFGHYEALQAHAQAMPARQALRTWVHGKLFWRHVVFPALGDALGVESEAALRRLVFRRMPLPQDIAALLHGLFFGGDFAG